jgi:hypothetical protein
LHSEAELALNEAIKKEEQYQIRIAKLLDDKGNLLKFLKIIKNGLTDDIRVNKNLVDAISGNIKTAEGNLSTFEKHLSFYEKE